MLTKADKEWIESNFATKNDLLGLETKMTGEFSSLEDRIEEKAKERHNELLEILDHLVTNYRLDRLEGSKV